MSRDKIIIASKYFNFLYIQVERWQYENVTNNQKKNGETFFNASKLRKK